MQYPYLPRTFLTSLFGFKPPKEYLEFCKTRVKQVQGIHIYIHIITYAYLPFDSIFIMSFNEKARRYKSVDINTSDESGAQNSWKNWQEQTGAPQRTSVNRLCNGLYLAGLKPRRMAASMKLCTSSTSCNGRRPASWANYIHKVMRTNIDIKRGVFNIDERTCTKQISCNLSGSCKTSSRSFKQRSKTGPIAPEPQELIVGLVKMKAMPTGIQCPKSMTMKIQRQNLRNIN